MSLRENVAVFRVRFEKDWAERGNDLWTLRDLRVEFLSVAASRVRDRQGAVRPRGRVRVVPIEAIVGLDDRRIGVALPEDDDSPVWRFSLSSVPSVPYGMTERIRFFVRARVDRFGTGAADTTPPLFSEEAWIALRAPRDPYGVRIEAPPRARPVLAARIRNLLAVPRPAEAGETTLVRLLVARGDDAARVRIGVAWDGVEGEDRAFSIRAGSGETEILWPVPVPLGAREGRVFARLERSSSDSESRVLLLPIRVRPPSAPGELPALEMRLEGPREAGAEGEMRLEVRAIAPFEGTASMTFGSGETVAARVRLGSGERTVVSRGGIPLPPGLWEVEGEVHDASGRRNTVRRSFDIDPLLPEFDPLVEARVEARIPIENLWDGLLRIPPASEVEIDFPVDASPGELRSEGRLHFARVPPGWTPPERLSVETPIVTIRNSTPRAVHLPPPSFLVGFAPGGGVRLVAAAVGPPDTMVDVVLANPDRLRPPRAARLVVGGRGQSVLLGHGEMRRFEIPLGPLDPGRHEVRVAVEEGGAGETVLVLHSAGPTPRVRYSLFGARTPRGTGFLHRVEAMRGEERAVDLRLVSAEGAVQEEIAELPPGEEAWVLSPAPSEIRDGTGRLVAEAPGGVDLPVPAAADARLVILPAPADETPAVGAPFRVRALLAAGAAAIPAGAVCLVASNLATRVERAPPLDPGEAVLLALPWRPIAPGGARVLVWARAGSTTLADEASFDVAAAGGPGAWEAGFVRTARYRRASDSGSLETPPALPSDLAFDLAQIRLAAAAAEAESGPRAGALRREAARRLASGAREDVGRIAARADLSAGAGPEDLEALASFGERAARLAASPRPVPPGEVGRRTAELETALRKLLFGGEISVDALGRFRSISPRDGS